MASKLENLPILAIDYGARRIGLAISDRNGLVASALDTIEFTKNRGLDVIVKDLVEIIERNRVKSLLIGMPQAFVEGNTKIQDEITDFTDALRKSSGLNANFIDESFTTAEAKSVLLSLGQRGKKNKGRIDRMSAALFLQLYLDNHQIVENNIEY